MLLAHAQPAALTAVIATGTARHLTDAPAVTLAHGYALILLIGPAVAALAGPGAPWIIYPVFAVWALVTYANLVHRPVEPWCPHCRGWGRDDGETDPVPLPIPAAGATR